MPGQEGFLARWSRRKLQPEAEEEVLPVESEAAAEPALTDNDMPPLESLTGESEFSGFLSPGVSEELRRLALRKLFHTPLFNLTDGLDDYDEDFTSFVRLGDLITCDMRHQMEQEAKRVAEQAAEAEEAAPERVVADNETEPQGLAGTELQGPEDDMTEEEV